MISIGKLCYLYDLIPESAHQLADTLEAVLNSEVLCRYKGKAYSESQFNSIVNDLRAEGKNLPDIIPSVVHLPNNSKLIALLPDDGLYHWATASSELDSLIIEAYRESLRKEYKRPPADRFAKVNYYREKNPLEALSLALLDTAVVDMNNAFRWLKNRGYTPPSRQLFDGHPSLGFSWEEFQERLKLAHGTSLSPHGGSRPDTPKIKATTAMCEKVQNDFIASPPQPTSLSIHDFRERVRTAMQAKGQQELFQPSAADKFFRGSNVLAKYKTKRGRPRK